MPANIECPCGHSVRVPDELLNSRIKCPVCGELLSAAAAQSESVFIAEATRPSVTASTSKATPLPEEEDSTFEMKKTPGQPHSQSPGGSPPSFKGTGAFFFLGLPMPACFTQSSLILLPIEYDSIRLDCGVDDGRIYGCLK